MPTPERWATCPMVSGFMVVLPPSAFIIDPVAYYRVKPNFSAIFPARLTNRLLAVFRRRGQQFPGVSQVQDHDKMAAFSTVAGGVASDLEDHAAQGRLEEARPLVGQFETMADELVRLASGLSLETLRQQTGPADRPNRTASL